MKRGFLDSEKAKKKLESSQSSSSKKLTTPSSYGTIPETGVPKDYETKFEAQEYSGFKMDYDPREMIWTSVPLVDHRCKLADMPEGWTECLISGPLKHIIHETPDFPREPLSPSGGKAYWIGPAGNKGIWMFSKRFMAAREMIVDERPMMLMPSCTAAASKNLTMKNVGEYTVEQRKQIVLHGLNRMVQVTFDRMPPEHQKAFMELHNSHTHDGSGELVGRVRTNALKALPDTTGRAGSYVVICKDLSRINHSPPSYAMPLPPGQPRDSWIEVFVERLQELEEEQLEASREYKRTLFQLVKGNAYLQNVGQVLLFANRLKNLYKAWESEDLNVMYLSEEGIKSTPAYLMGEMSRLGLPMPVMGFQA
ncbi:hypothetical protein GYMLUDRAFT_254778 [Collybiopsis luxurians FD-317 M1]|nr:hypothetical protein GYMLUDRAFT_254778 [Collybiopsis luxurians FD-317 M1]